jgi:death-on-curing protein
MQGALLTTGKIIEIHNDIIQTFGGEQGIRDEATLEYLVYEVNHAKDIFRKAAIALHSICTSHPFFDGNKRTAFAVAENILAYMDLCIGAPEDEVVGFMLRVASYTHNRASVMSWIKENAKSKAAEPV